nr:MAG TPA: hypothetical protein [Caudoviricetes sp.]
MPRGGVVYMTSPCLSSVTTDENKKGIKIIYIMSTI